MENASVVQLLRERAERSPDKRAYTFLSDGVEVETLTFGELDLRARAIAARLQERGAAGERALLLFPPGLDYIAAFYGCLAAGAVAVPAYPPRMNRNLKRLDSVLTDSSPKFLLTTDAVARQLEQANGERTGELGKLDWIVTSLVADVEASKWTDPHAMTGTLAFLQYTSASTSAAKGVMVTHGNILHNQALMKTALRHNDETVIVSWLPLFHDMGLIGNVLASLYNGVPCHLMAPVDFLKKPRLWLEAITRYRATFSGAPDFGYQLCTERIPAAEREGLDLSSWKVAFNGSEPVRADTLRNFAEAFVSCGFDAGALFPCYGLAENTLFATGRFHEAPVAFTRASLEVHRPRIASGEASSSQLVSCGGTALDQRVAVADPATGRRCGDDEIGEIWLASPSAAQGYWNQPELSEHTFRARLTDGDGPYMRTGDLGFLHNGQLFVTGRLKDLIIIRGRNLVPTDIEQVVEQCDPAIRATFVAAVSVETEQGERLVIAAEVRREARHDLDTTALIEKIRSAVTSAFEVEVSAVALLRPGALPKTSSGKTQRAQVKRAWVAGELDCLAQWRNEIAFRQPATATMSSGRGLEGLERWLVSRIASLAQMAVERVDVNRSILAFGLDSVVVISLLADVEKTFGVTIDVERLFDGEPAVREVVQRIRNDARGAQKVVPIARPEKWKTDNPVRLQVAATTEKTDRQDRLSPTHPFREHVNPELGRLLAQMGMDKSFVRGEGSWLWDEEGNRYLDFLAQYGCLPFGFNPPRIWQALMDVRDTAEPSFVQPSFLNAAGELAKRLINVLPPGMQYVTFANSGAEAIEAAIKLCRSTTKRKKILAASNGFHGKTLGALSATDKRKYQEPFFAPIDGFEYVPYGDLDALRRKLATGEFAGFFVEPLQGEGGIVEPPTGYLRAARKACRDVGTLFVADEIQTGLGRTGAMFVCKELGITPDVMTLAKALGGGLMPIGACVSTAAAYNEDFACNHTSTFAGNTLACRAGLATLDLLEENRGALVRQVAENGARLRDGLLELQRRYPSLIGEVRGRGYFLGLKFGVDRNTFDDGLLGFIGEHDALTALIVSHMLHSEKIRVGYTLNHGGILRIEPPLTTTWEECRYFLDALERVLARMASRSLAELTAQVTGYVEDGQASPSPGQRGQAGLPVLHIAKKKSRLQPREDEGRFAFLVHPLAWKDFADLDGTLAVLNDEQMKKLSTAIADNFDPMVVAETRVTANDGRTAGRRWRRCSMRRGSRKSGARGSSASGHTPLS
jgi:acetylornithine/succinyldiaminopimelate/putrescine aminotransferase/acyl-CoA synthetase (AMP-forming)/AMP-acid ligase II/acyl carrier protein